VFARNKIVKQNGKVYEYVQIVESYRDEQGVSRQRLVRSLGNRADLDAEQIDRLIASLERFGGRRPAMDGEEVDILESRRFGDVFVLTKLWEELGLKGIFDELAAGEIHEFSLADALFTMVANRAIDPRSKLDTVRWAQRDVFLPQAAGLNEDHLYKTLTWLNGVKDPAETAIFERVAKVRSSELRLVLYDTSALHFETQDGPVLAEHGRPGRYQRGKKIVLVALVTTFDGWPIYHHVFPGSTADSKTVEPILNALRDRFKVGRVIVLADNGMVNSKTLAILDKLGFDYLAAMKMKETVLVRDRVVGRAGRYHEVDPNLRVKEVNLEGRRFVVCYNPDEASRDGARRESILAKLRSELEGGVEWSSQKGAELRTNRAYKRYLVRGRGELKGKLAISEARVQADGRYDGKWVVHTSRKDLPADDVACLFKCEGAIEHDWRDLKSVLGLRPVRHWTEANVRGHVFVCVLAKILLRELQRRLDGKFAATGSPPTVLEDLGRIAVVEFETRRGVRWQRARHKPEHEELLLVLGVDPQSVPKTLDGEDKPARAPREVITRGSLSFLDRLATMAGGR
jgi:hypothetical protein